MSGEGNQSVRQSNFELLRILCMFLIVGYHITGQTEMSRFGIGDGADYYYCLLIGSAGRLVCNTFVMIGAWFLVDSKFKPERAVNLWLEIFFYSVTITIVCLLIGCENATITTLIQAFFPVFGRPVWFGAEYICLILLTPWLNAMLGDKRCRNTIQVVKMFGILMIGCATLFPVEHTTPAFSELTWFCFLYLFIGLYKHHQILSFQWNEKYSLLWFVLSYFLLCGMKVAADLMDVEFLRYLFTYYSQHYEAFLGFICSFFLFLTFKNLDIGYSRWVNLISRSSFAVYIIHQTPAFYRYMWNGIFHVDKAVADGKGIYYSLIVMTMIFVVSVCVDNIRIRAADRLIFKSRTYGRICSWIWKFYQR